MVTAKVKIHSSAIKTNNLRIKSAHFLSRLKGKTGMHGWHSTGHGLKHFRSSQVIKTCMKLGENLHVETTHKDPTVAVKCTV